VAGKLTVQCPLADLTINGPTGGSDGFTVTVPMSNAVAPLSPASAITGFTLSINSVSASLTVTSSASTVTIVSATKFFKTDTVTLSLATHSSSNLTDSAVASGSWPNASGNTNVSVDVSAAPSAGVQQTIETAAFIRLDQTQAQGGATQTLATVQNRGQSMDQYNNNQAATANDIVTMPTGLWVKPDNAGGTTALSTTHGPTMNQYIAGAR
jgi:hypothetical protein